MNYFPIVIRYIDETETRTIHNPEDVECGRPFRVIRTAYDNQDSQKNNSNLPTQ